MIRLLLPLALLLTACQDGGKADSADDTTDSGGGDGDVVQPDADGDTILDIHDGTEEDADGDGKLNFEDRDADGDSIKDRNEAGDGDLMTLPVDSDGDGVEDFLDLDSDNNCVTDASEAGRTDGDANDTDGDGTKDFQDTDNDGDGIPDTSEITDCLPADTDADNTPDYMDDDSDGDGIGDVFEGGTTDFSDEPVDTDGDGTPDYRDTDSDNDTILDSDESNTNGDASVEPRDTDNDGRYDYADTDADGDALSELEELAAGTDPYDPDTDGDGYSDGGEIAADTDPLDSTSVIDGIYVEVAERTTVEEDFDFELNIEMGDIAFIIDTTCSMGGTINAVASEFATIVTDLSSVLPDAAYGVGGHDDYAYGGYGSSSYSDKPFYLRQQVTTDTSLVQTAFSGLTTHGGSDGPESGTEALYQAASGAGYDQDCDGSYDTTTDVPPFMAGSATDVYGGSVTDMYDASTPGGGTLGGFGFRDYALPVVVLAGDNYLRDPESSGYYSGVPGGCYDAGMSDAVNAFLDLGAYFVGVSVNGTLGYPQMVTFAQQIGSYADLDGDGVSDEEVVTTWSGSNAAFRTTVVNAITELVSSVRFSRVDLSVDGDAYGFVSSIDPEYYEGLGAEDSGEILSFTLTFRGVVAATTEDQLYRLTLNVLGDSSILLDSMDIIVVVPGTAY